MIIRHAISVLTFGVALYMVAFGALLVYMKGFPITHWVVLEKLLVGCVSLVAGALLWRGHRFMRIAALFAWGLTGVWLTSLIVAALNPS